MQNMKNSNVRRYEVGYYEDTLIGRQFVVMYSSKKFTNAYLFFVETKLPILRRVVGDRFHAPMIECYDPESENWFNE